LTPTIDFNFDWQPETAQDVHSSHLYVYTQHGSHDSNHVTIDAIRYIPRLITTLTVILKQAKSCLQYKPSYEQNRPKV